MRKLYACVKKFISNHYNLSFFFAVNILLISGIAFFHARLTTLVATFFSFSLLALCRLITYKTGKIPFAKDSTYYYLRRKYSDDELEEKYEKMSIKRATIYFIIAVLSFFAWIVCELLVFLI
jgi:hypothetical protein